MESRLNLEKGFIGFFVFLTMWGFYMFAPETAWMINPRKTRTRRKSRRLKKGVKVMARRKRRSSGRKRRMPAGLAAYWAGKRKAKSNPGRKRRRRAARRNPIVRAHRRRASVSHRRRSYRRNPGGFKLPTSGFIMDAAMVTGGFFATRFAAGMVLPMIPMADQPIVRIVGKGAVAWGLGFLGGKFLGAKAGQLILLGGMVEALSDAVRTYVAPFVPALASDGVGSYPSIGSYPNLSSYDSPYAVSAADMGYDE